MSRWLLSIVDDETLKQVSNRKKTYDKENIINDSDNKAIAFRIRSAYVLCIEKTDYIVIP